MATVTLYKVTCDKGYMMSEQGSSYSLYPWGSDTDYYQGHDDGGKAYQLPEGCEVAEGKDNSLHIYDTKGRPCALVVHSSGRPQLCIDYHTMPVLSLAV